MAGQVDRDLAGGERVPWACWRSRSAGVGEGGTGDGDDCVGGVSVTAVDVRVLLTCSNHHRDEGCRCS